MGETFSSLSTSTSITAVLGEARALGNSSLFFRRNAIAFPRHTRPPASRNRAAPSCPWRRSWHHKKFLPLANHAEMAVVQNEDLDGKPIFDSRHQLLDVHLDGTVSRDIDYKAIRESSSAPIAAGSPYPIVPRPPEVKYVRGL